MLYRVTNNTPGPRAIFHGGRHTHLDKGQTRIIKMLKAEAENAEVPGLEIVKDADAVDPADAPIDLTNLSRADLIELAVADFRMHLAEASDDDLRDGVTVLLARRAQLTSLPGEAEFPTRVYATGGIVAPEASPVSLPDGQARPAGDTFGHGLGADGQLSDPLTGDGSGEARAPALKAVHRGGGHYAIMSDDKEVQGGLSKDDAKAFNEMDAQAQAAFVADVPKA